MITLTLRSLALIEVHRQTAASKSTKPLSTGQHLSFAFPPIPILTKPPKTSTHAPSFRVSMGHVSCVGDGGGHTEGGGLGVTGSGVEGGGLGTTGSGVVGGGFGTAGDGVVGGGLGITGVGVRGGGTTGDGIEGGGFGTTGSGVEGGGLGTTGVGVVGGGFGTIGDGVEGGGFGTTGDGVAGGGFGIHEGLVSGGGLLGTTGDGIEGGGLGTTGSGVEGGFRYHSVGVVGGGFGTIGDGVEGGGFGTTVCGCRGRWLWYNGGGVVGGGFGTTIVVWRRFRYHAAAEKVGSLKNHRSLESRRRLRRELRYVCSAWRGRRRLRTAVFGVIGGEAVLKEGLRNQLEWKEGIGTRCWHQGESLGTSWRRWRRLRNKRVLVSEGGGFGTLSTGVDGGLWNHKMRRCWRRHKDQRHWCGRRRLRMLVLVVLMEGLRYPRSWRGRRGLGTLVCGVEEGFRNQMLGVEGGGLGIIGNHGVGVDGGGFGTRNRCRWWRLWNYSAALMEEALELQCLALMEGLRNQQHSVDGGGFGTLGVGVGRRRLWNSGVALMEGLGTSEGLGTIGVGVDGGALELLGVGVDGGGFGIIGAVLMEGAWEPTGVNGGLWNSWSRVSMEGLWNHSAGVDGGFRNLGVGVKGELRPSGLAVGGLGGCTMGGLRECGGGFGLYGGCGLTWGGCGLTWGGCFGGLG
uniref:Uncharacterized protein n=1 Tax=Cannabis sativa TaxID=3483 RepID=A0A803QIR7_CANSA